MAVIKLSYNQKGHYEKVNRFLIKHYDYKKPIVWEQPRWEYMHHHPFILKVQELLSRFGVWIDDSRPDENNIVGLVHFEDSLGNIYYEIDPDYAFLIPEMISHAEKNLYKTTEDGKKYLHIMVLENQTSLKKHLQETGYKRDLKGTEQDLIMHLTEEKLKYTLPEGFKIQSLEDENDLRKIDRVLHRGFNHDGEPPADGIDGRIFMQSAPNFRKDLTIVTVAPNGDYASICGLWIDPLKQFAYLELVATDPTYRRMGLGKAGIYESLSRALKEGVKVATVGPKQDFYVAIGFEDDTIQESWNKTF